MDDIMAWLKHTPCTCKYIGVYGDVFEIDGGKMTDYNCFEINILVRLLNKLSLWQNL